MRNPALKKPGRTAHAEPTCRFAPRAWLAASLLAVAAGCGGGTNHTVMVVSVASDLSIGGELDKVNLVVADGELSYPFALGSGPGKVALPIRVALVPGGKNDRQFRVQAIGVLGGDDVVTQSATVSFVSGTAQQLSLFLARSCVRFPMCNDGFTCQNGACVSEATAGTRSTYDGDAGGMSSIDGGSGGRIDAGDAGGIGGTTGSGGSGTGGSNGSGGTPGTGGGGGTGGLNGIGGSGAGGFFGIGGNGAGAGTGTGGSGAGGFFGIGGNGAGAGTGTGGSGAGGFFGIGGNGAGAGTGTGGSGTGGFFGIGGNGAGAGTGTGGGGTGGFFVTGLDGGTIGTGGISGGGGIGGAPSGTVLFSDNFETGNAAQWTPLPTTEWSVVTGSGSDNSRVYQEGISPTGDSALATAGDPTWTNVSLEVSVNVTSFIVTANPTYTVSIDARYNANGNSYQMTLREGIQGGTVDLRRTVNGVPTILTMSNPGIITANVWYTLRLTIVGTTLTGYLNGTPILTANDGTYSAGKIGVEASGPHAQFDNVTVTVP